MAKKVVLAGACRTAIGTMGGTLSTTPAPELGAIVIKEALKRAGVAPEAVDYQSRTSHRSSRSYHERGMWFWPELCEPGSTDDHGR
mgnify:CR=1 FL=1